jgi:hypothetical protein
MAFLCEIQVWLGRHARYDLAQACNHDNSISLGGIKHQKSIHRRVVKAETCLKFEVTPIDNPRN